MIQITAIDNYYVLLYPVILIFQDLSMIYRVSSLRQLSQMGKYYCVGEPRFME